MKQNPGYESVLIISNQLTDEDIKTLVAKMEGVVASNGGKMIHSEPWNRRKLSYPIKKINHGYYHIFYFQGNGIVVKELSLQSSYEENVLRCFTCAVDDLEASHKGFLELKADPMVNLQKLEDAQNKGA